jgi:glycosyltransferase involved in cell wall biosynthesis
MKDAPLVCVVMPAYEAADTIARAARSVLDQPYDRLVLAVSVYPDDRATIDAVDALADDRIRVIRRSGHGIANGRNAALRAVEADLYMFLDSDDAYCEDVVRRYVEDHRAFPLPTLRYGDWTAVSPLDGSMRRRHMYLPKNDVHRALLLGNFIGSGTVMLDAQILADVGGFDEAYPHAEDWDLWLRIARRYPLRHVPVNATFYTRTKLTRIYPRSFFMHEIAIARARGAGSRSRSLAVGLAFGRYGAYYLGTLRQRRSLSLLLDVRPVDLILAPAAAALRAYRMLSARRRA